VLDTDVAHGDTCDEGKGKEPHSLSCLESRHLTTVN
jgi:hypothetical protein